MNSDKNVDSVVPKGWILCTSKSNPGRKYYFNRRTGKSSWTKPQEEDMSPDNPKQKNGKEQAKTNIALKTPEVNPHFKNMKRKSDGETSQCFNKKTKTEHPSPQKTPNTNQQMKPKNIKPTPERTPVKSPQKQIRKEQQNPFKAGNRSRSSSKPSPRIQPTLSKNIANSRMKQLRAQLTIDAKKNKFMSTPGKTPDQCNKVKLTPKTSQSRSEAKQKVDLKSPNLNESKGSLQSPNDSLQSDSSPSQFLAANKIISSMIAHLPEEYDSKMRQKDTFADIEQGINSQTSEQPYMKHPATPPQFSEASKLMSAIKSRLSYKSPKECIAGFFNSASEKLEPMELSSEVMDVNVRNSEYVVLNGCSANEYMDVDVREVKQNETVQSKTNVPIHANVGSSNENVVLVVDTNIFIHELDFIKNIMSSHVKGYKEQPTLLVPWRVVNELDKLKDNNNGNGAVCKRARPAMDYLYKYLPENNRIRVQPLRDANSHIYPCESPDDEILNCCLQQAERGKSVILLSNDKNLCTKAAANGVPHKSLRELALQPSPPPHAHAHTDVQKHIYTLLANILENEMRAKYNDLWLHVVFKAPPWSLADVLSCILKHWIAVFHEVFPRIEHLLIDLKNCYGVIERKASKNVTQSELSNFKDLCLDIAKRCQIIPEYMELAKKTVARLQRDGASESGDEDDKTAESDKDNDSVIKVFEGVWTVFSSYCAKLASGLGIPHSLEDKLDCDDSMEVLISKLHLFTEQITTLSRAMEGLLNGNIEVREDCVNRLERTFKEVLDTIGISAEPVDKPGLRKFTTNCRNMLQEAHTKFSQLVDILQICKHTVAGSK